VVQIPIQPLIPNPVVLTAEEREARRRESRREYLCRYRAAHRQEERERARRWQVAHPEQRREYRQRYYAERGAYARQCSAAYRAEGRDKRPCVDCGKPCKGRREAPRCLPCNNKFYRQGYKGGTVTVRGYRQMFVDGRKRYEHALVWEAAYGPRPKGWVVHHLNGDKLDNRLCNLLAMPNVAHHKLHRMVDAGTISLRQAAEEASVLYGRQAE
jgi:hypothetical protein